MISKIMSQQELKRKKRTHFFLGHNFVLHMEEADLKTDALAKYKQCLGLSIGSGSQLLSLVSGLE